MLDEVQAALERALGQERLQVEKEAGRVLSTEEALAEARGVAR